METDAPAPAVPGSVTADIPVVLPNGAHVRISGTLGSPTGERDVSFKMPSFEKVAQIVEGIGDSLHAVGEKLKPSKLTVEFGLEIKVESGELTALLVKGEGTSHLTVEFEWERPKSAGEDEKTKQGWT
jgi:hypothetical protein